MQQLRDQLARLKTAVGWAVIYDGLRGALTETQSRILARLYRAPAGAFVPVHDLEMMLPSLSMVDLNTIPVHVNRIHKALGAKFVENRRLGGYRLSEAGRAKLDEIMGAI